MDKEKLEVVQEPNVFVPKSPEELRGWLESSEKKKGDLVELVLPNSARVCAVFDVVKNGKVNFSRYEYLDGSGGGGGAYTIEELCQFLEEKKIGSEDVVGVGGERHAVHKVLSLPEGREATVGDVDGIIAALGNLARDPRESEDGFFAKPDGFFPGLLGGLEKIRVEGSNVSLGQVMERLRRRFGSRSDIVELLDSLQRLFSFQRERFRNAGTKEDRLDKEAVGRLLPFLRVSYPGGIPLRREAFNIAAYGEGRSAEIWQGDDGDHVSFHMNGRNLLIRYKGIFQEFPLNTPVVIGRKVALDAVAGLPLSVPLNPQQFNAYGKDTVSRADVIVVLDDHGHLKVALRGKNPNWGYLNEDGTVGGARLEAVEDHNGNCSLCSVDLRGIMGKNDLA